MFQRFAGDVVGPRFRRLPASDNVSTFRGDGVAHHLIDGSAIAAEPSAHADAIFHFRLPARASQKLERESGHSHYWDSPFLSDAQTSPSQAWWNTNWLIA